MEISRLQGLLPLPGIIGTPNWETPQIAVTFAAWFPATLFPTAELLAFRTPRL
jgi:hypothetical protein